MVMRAWMIAVILAIAAPAARADKAEDARKLFEAGRQAYESNQYGMAIQLFEEAYRLAPRPSVVFALGQAYRRQHLVDGDPAKLTRAIDYYREYLAGAPTGDRRDEALKHIEQLELVRASSDRPAREGATPEPPRARTQIVVFSSTPSAHVSVDGGEPQPAPYAADVAPGKHSVRVTADGFIPREVEGVAVEGRLIPIEVSLVEQPAKLTIDAHADAELELDGRRLGRVPRGRALEVPAGRHYVAVLRHGHRPVAREIVLGRGESATMPVRFEWTTQRHASLWILGGAGALLVAGAVTTGLALDAASDADALQAEIDAMRPLDPEERDRHNDAVDRYDRFTTASAVLYGGALVLGVTAALLYVFDTPEAAPPPLLRPSIVSDGAAIGVGAAWGTSF